MVDAHDIHSGSVHLSCLNGTLYLHSRLFHYSEGLSNGNESVYLCKMSLPTLQSITINYIGNSCEVVHIMDFMIGE